MRSRKKKKTQLKRLHVRFVRHISLLVSGLDFSESTLRTTTLRDCQFLRL